MLGWGLGRQRGAEGDGSRGKGTGKKGGMGEDIHDTEGFQGPSSLIPQKKHIQMSLILPHTSLLSLRVCFTVVGVFYTNEYIHLQLLFSSLSCLLDKGCGQDC